jgi:hypothetical protein
MTPEKYFLIHSQHKAISDSAKRLQRKELIFIKMEYQHDFSTAPKAELALLTEKGFRQASSIGMVNENSPDIIRIYDSSGEYHGEYFRAYDESPDGTRLPLYDEEDMMVDTLPMIDSARGLEGESTQ